MPDIRQGLSGGQGGDVDDINTDTGFEAALARKVGKQAPARRAATASEPRGKRARHHAGTITGDRGTGRAARLSPEGMARLMGEGDELSRDVASGLTRTRPGERPARGQTAAEIRAEAKAKFPESWSRAEAMRKQAHERGSEASADTAELHALRLDRAIEEGDEALVFARARELAQASPSGFQEFLSGQDEQYLAEADAAGLDPDEIADTDLPSYTFGNAIRESLAVERAQRAASVAADLKDRETSERLSEYESLLGQDLAPRLSDDGQGFDEDYESLRVYVHANTGVDVHELALSDPAEAARWMKLADKKINNWAAELEQHAFKKQITGAETASVADGLETGLDRQAKQLAELVDLQRAAQGLGPADEPPAPFFSPDEVLEPTKAEQEDPPITVGEFKESLKEGEGVQSDDAWTKGGEPTTFEDVTRNPEHEREVERESAYRAGFTR